MEMLLATGNAAKAREFSDLLGGDRFEWRRLSDFAPVACVEETGSSFRGNAVLKASGYARTFGLWTLADDSGLEVDALGGQPGVHSARWAMMHNAGRGDIDNNRLLLQQLQNVPDGHRSGRFVCVLALADPSGRVLLTVGDSVEGRILRAAVGENGFGYDPLFYVDALERTTAQLPPQEKHQISHRGKAVGRLKKWLDEIDLAAASGRG